MPESSSTVAKFGFLDLCGKPMSAADYIEITKNFGSRPGEFEQVCTLIFLSLNKIPVYFDENN